MIANYVTVGKKECLAICIVYKATVTETTSNNQETYIGLTENEFKTRFNLHKSSFKLEHKRTSTTFSEHVWKLKKNNFGLYYRNAIKFMHLEFPNLIKLDYASFVHDPRNASVRHPKEWRYLDVSSSSFGGELK